MKTIRNAGIASIFLLAAAVTFGQSAVAGRAAETAKKQGQYLQVEVTLAPALLPRIEDSIRDAFVTRLIEVFSREGMTDPIVETGALQETDNSQGLLRIHVIEWDLSPIGNLDLRFSATLTKGDDARFLGIFNAMTPRAGLPSGHNSLEVALDNSAGPALKELYRAIARTGLVPGAKLG